MIGRVVRWLRADRLPLASQAEADASLFQYGLRPSDGRYTTSILGIINGFLPLFGIVLVCHFDADSVEPQPPYFSFRRRWWTG